MGCCTGSSSGFFDALLAGYRRTLDIALRFEFVTLMVFFATMALTAYLYIQIPKGFFPTQDTGVMLGITEAGQDVSFAEMARRQQAAADIVANDPAVAAISSSIGAGLGGQTGNNGRLWITLKPFDERDVNVQQVIARLRPEVAKIEGMNVYFQPAQDINVGGRLARTQYQYTVQDADLNELYEWAPKILAKLRSLPMLRDVATDQQVAGTTATLTIDRDRAARFGIQPQAIDDTLYDAFGQRQIAQYFTQLNSYKVIIEVPPDLQGDVGTLDRLYVRSPAQNAIPLSTFVKVDTRPVVPLAISHQSQFPSVTLSFNLAPGAALGQAVDAIDAAMAQIGTPGDAARHLPGDSTGVPVFVEHTALPDRSRAHRGVHHPRRAL